MLYFPEDPTLGRGVLPSLGRRVTGWREEGPARPCLSEPAKLSLWNVWAFQCGTLSFGAQPKLPNRRILPVIIHSTSSGTCRLQGSLLWGLALSVPWPGRVAITVCACQSCLVLLSTMLARHPW